jgi:ABC-2 family transporter
MIENQVALVRRELWEHRSLYVVPAVLGIVLVLATVTGQVSISAFGAHVDMALLGATNIGTAERGAGISALLAVFASLFVFAMSILTVFYALDSLYAERKDKSILFWRSMPVTDAETVISKLITAVVVIPLITLAFIAITHQYLGWGTRSKCLAPHMECGTTLRQLECYLDFHSGTFTLAGAVRRLVPACVRLHQAFADVDGGVATPLVADARAQYFWINTAV